MALLRAHFDVGHQFSRQDLTSPQRFDEGTVQTVNGICIGQRNCGDAIVSGGTLARAAPQQIGCRLVASTAIMRAIDNWLDLELFVIRMAR